mgnify:FL=1|tara:strand:- start:339 stop:455 length:117 start_codon:yes stop_codon:yes gene_type:complete
MKKLIILSKAIVSIAGVFFPIAAVIEIVVDTINELKED